MNLKQAYYIKVLAEVGSISGAARKLCISQPSLSQMLHQVEEDLGVLLFERSSKPLRPTYAGERYLHAASIILNTNAILKNELREIQKEGSGRLRLGISMQRSAQLLPKILPEFTASYPQVELVLTEAGSNTLEKILREGAIDLALATTESSAFDLNYRLIEEETIGILTGKASPLAQKYPPGSPIELFDAVGAGFVSLKQGHSIRAVQDYLFKDQGFSPAFYIETDSSETARRVTEQCNCYMLCSGSALGKEAYFYPLKDYRNRRHFYACSRKGQILPQYMVAFIDLICAKLQV